MTKRVATFFAYMAVLLALSAASNPPAEGFDEAGSDPEATALADQVMEAMGGRLAWDQTRYLSWRFFDRRTHYWDRYSGDIRIEGKTGEDDGERPFVLLFNVNQKAGRVFLAGEEITNEEELEPWFERAYGMWVNDSYWVFMPYKLKDSGVTLEFLGQRETEDYGQVEVLGLTFREVGLSPQNRYEVFVDSQSKLVSGWSYFSKAEDEEPEFTMPWADWQRVGQILLANEHGRGLEWQLRSFEELPRSVFESPAAVQLGSGSGR